MTEPTNPTFQLDALCDGVLYPVSCLSTSEYNKRVAENAELKKQIAEKKRQNRRNEIRMQQSVLQAELDELQEELVKMDHAKYKLIHSSRSFFGKVNDIRLND